MTSADELLAEVGFKPPDSADVPAELADKLDKLNLPPAVRDEAVTQWTRAEARRALAKIEAGQTPEPGLTLLADLLDEPDEDPEYRVHGLLPTGGRVMLTAQHKTGKTTLVLNLVRCLADWQRFLSDGEDDESGFDVRPLLDGEKVAVFDLELDRRTLRRWLRKQGIVNTERVLAGAFRGRVGELDLLDDERRTAWAAYLRGHGVKVLVLDCLAPLLTLYGFSENDNTDMAKVLAALDELVDAAGVEELVVVHHMGHSEERSRGASRLRDWPDAEWRLTREGADIPGAQPPPDAARFFAAEGRDVKVAERELKHNGLTERVWTVDGNRAELHMRKRERKILDAVENNPGATGRDIAGNNGTMRTALAELVRRGAIHTCPGKRTAVHHVLADGCATPSDCPTAQQARDGLDGSK